MQDQLIVYNLEKKVSIVMEIILTIIIYFTLWLEWFKGSWIAVIY